MNSVFTGKENCCGCSACQQICPASAIAMEPDKEGFLYPVINQAACIDCEQCVQVCPLIKEGNAKEPVFANAYAAKHKADDVKMTSTSGGAFTALSDYILKQNGVVYGVDFAENFKICHKKARTAPERDRFKISKYAQSDLKDTFADIETELSHGTPVLFTGTPCQTAGLRSFIGNHPAAKNLYVCDIICYGIPSPLIWQEYLRHLEVKYGDKIESVHFRSKVFAWNRPNSNRNFMCTTKNCPQPHVEDDYYTLYFSARTIMRPSCSQCRFTDSRRAADITIADYWGIEKYVPEFMDSKGVSLILINSAKGKRLFEQVKQDLDYAERPAAECLAEQQRLREPVKFPENRGQFWEDYYTHGFPYLIDKYVNNID